MSRLDTAWTLRVKRVVRKPVKIDIVMRLRMFAVRRVDSTAWYVLCLSVCLSITRKAHYQTTPDRSRWTVVLPQVNTVTC